MRNIIHYCLLVISLVLLTAQVKAQDRFAQIEQTLKDLSNSSVPGLKEKAEFSVSGSSIQEFLRALAETNNLNISVDPNLNFKIYNNFTGEKVMNIILFLVKEYDLDIRFVGSIMSFSKYNAPTIISRPIREVDVKYNNFSNLISMDLKNDTLEVVAKKITQASKKNIVLTSGIGNKLVSSFILDMPFDNAIQKMAYANNLKVIKTEDDFYILKTMEEGDELLVATPLNAQNKKTAFPRRPPVRNTTQTPTSGQLYVEVNKDSSGNKLVSIEATNSPIIDALKKVTEEMELNYFLLTELKGNTTMRAVNVFYEDFLNKLFLGTEYTYRSEAGMYIIGERKQEGLRTHSVFQFKYRSFDQVQDIIPADLKKGVEIKEFKNLNSIVMTGSYPQILEIEALLKKLDRVVPMILIEVILVDIRKTRSVSTGISAGLSDTAKGGGKILPGIDYTWTSKSINSFLSFLGTNNTINIGRVTPDFYFKLNALESNNNVEVRSTPKLSTLNGHEASLAIGQKRYYANQTQNVLGSLNPQTVVTQQFNEVQANLAINIRPVVSGDDQVTLNIDVSNSDFLDAPTNAPPASTNSQFKSIIRVKNEEMVVLGGLERNEKSDKGSGIPLLSRIPVLKWIFSSKTKAKSKAVTIVFIKPTIIY